LLQEVMGVESLADECDEKVAFGNVSRIRPHPRKELRSTRQIHSRE
jgi:hypothetical protein